VIKKLSGITVPRGLAFSHDGKFLYVASFEGGLILKYATDTWKEKKRIFKKWAAMRHIRVSPDNKTIFVSNMYHSEVYEIDADSFAILHTYKVFNNPNTIEIDEQAHLLFVSCRGPNNPGHYTWRSPKDGKVMVFDVEKKELLTTIQCGNQPTGLDLSNDGNLLVFSNFKDNTIELYDITKLKQMIALRDRDCFFPINLLSFIKAIAKRDPYF
jgi:DNA-binding beta-propeller fold protein YncE